MTSDLFSDHTLKLQTIKHKILLNNFILYMDPLLSSSFNPTAASLLALSTSVDYLSHQYLETTSP